MHSLTTLLPLLLIVSPALASPHGVRPLERSHHAHQRRNASSPSLQKRGFSGRATFFDVGLGACGNYNQPSDYIVALNQPQYEANNWCGKSITISYGGKTANAVIQDECPSCPYGALDMSKGLFSHFASFDAGVFYMSWSLNDGSGGGGDWQPTTSKWTPPPTTEWHAPSTTWKPDPTTTWTPDPTTSSYKWTPTPSSSKWTSSSSSSEQEKTVSKASTIGNLASRNSTLSAPSTLNATSSLPSASAIPSKASTVAGLPAIGAQENDDGSESAEAYGKGNLDVINGLVVAMGQIALLGAKAATQDS